ncbi:hypothetical protein L6164_008007 [Bauhinia variegata]|uniref:Uncharacterized protein n=1 Tax=Bauhinia variegata TaxID=167791 RepID=A0ACB9PEC9_BAUVA|nr:hypothetical protein L6164_008007 [Bauhinia variegata]
MEADQSQSPQIKGVVIISLPPPDNPSKGKTITAFTVSDSSPIPSQDFVQTHESQPHLNAQDSNLPLQYYPPNSQLQFSFWRVFLSSPVKLFCFLGILLFGLFLYGSVSSETLRELRGSEDDNGTDSFLFPLYPKLGVHGQHDVKLRLGKFVAVQKKNLINQRTRNMASTVAAVDSSSVFPVRGNVYPEGLYFTEVFVGTPPKRYFLDMDTGSDLTWIQCDAPCRSCAKGAHMLYKPTTDSILPPADPLCKEFQKNQKNGYCESCHQCDYEIEYADHSSSLGVLIRDELHLQTTNGSKTKLNFAFGCGYDQVGPLLNSLTKTDGIMGLSRAKVSLPFQLASKRIIKNVIGHCLSNYRVGGGYMFLGDDYVPYWGMTWVPMVNTLTTDLYQTKILGLNYGNSPLSLGGRSKVGNMVFDSGSSYTYFPKEAYLDLVASLKEVSQLGLNRDDSDTTLPICWQADFLIRSVKDVKHIFNTLTLRFGSKWWILSTLFQIPPENYLIISKKGNVCLAILDGTSVHDGSTFLLGDISLRGYLVVYDNANHRIGWEQSHCVMPAKVKKSHNLLTDTML